MRRCNLSCTYCNEYDDFSKPVPLDTMYQRLDQLAALGTTIITISGGEPLLHPELDQIIARIRQHGMIAGMITNGYLLTAERIQRLNRAGLEHLQISIDNVMPDEVSKKSLKVLDKKLQLLAEHAEFHVNINSVVGGGIHNPQDALAVGARAVELGFTSTVGIIHDGDGQLQPLSDEEREVYTAMSSWRSAVTRGSTTSRTTSRTARPTTGAAGPARATSTSARTGWCTTARSSAAIPAKPLPSTRRGHPPRIPHRKELRAALHRRLRSPDLVHGLLARPAGLIALGQPAGESWRPGAASVICVSVSPNVPQLYRVRDLPSGTEVHN